MPTIGRVKADREAAPGPEPDASAAALEAAFAAMDVGIAVVGGDGRFLRVNEAFARLHGVDPAGMPGQECTLVLTGGTPARRRLLRPGGGTVDVRVVATPMIDGPQAGATLVTLVDIGADLRAETELRHAAARAVEARAAASAFLAGMSEEVRVPLNAVMAFAEVLVNQALGPLEPHGYRAFAADIQASGRRLMEILGDVMEMAKLEAAETALDDEDVDLERLLTDAAQAVLGRSVGRDRALDCEVAWPVGVVLVDLRLFRRALESAMDAALSRAPPGGPLRIGAVPLPDGRCLISIGAPASTPSTGPGGTILRGMEGVGPPSPGLAVARAVAQAHGGTLLVERADGAGVGFGFVLPIQRVRRRRLAPVQGVLRVRNRPAPIARGVIDTGELLPLAGADYRLDALGEVLAIDRGDGPMAPPGACHLFDTLAPSLRAAGLDDLLRRGLAERDLDILLVLPCDARPGDLLHCRLRRAAAPDEAILTVRLI